MENTDNIRKLYKHLFPKTSSGKMLELCLNEIDNLNAQIKLLHMLVDCVEKTEKA